MKGTCPECGQFAGGHFAGCPEDTEDEHDGDSEPCGGLCGDPDCDLDRCGRPLKPRDDDE